MKRKNKKAAMEMSVGTIVTIVLLMTVLVLGLVLVKSVFFSGKKAIDQMDAAIEKELNKLFAEEGKRVVVYPATKEISMGKGDSGGFGFSIMNKESSLDTFTYTVTADSVGTNCQMTLEQADNLIILGKEGSVDLGSGNVMEDPVFVKFEIPESASLCIIRYKVVVDSGEEPGYSTASVDLQIK